MAPNMMGMCWTNLALAGLAQSKSAHLVDNPTAAINTVYVDRSAKHTHTHTSLFFSLLFHNDAHHYDDSKRNHNRACG